MIIEIPDLLPERISRFSPQELEQLRLILSNPVYQKLLAVAECAKPSPSCRGAGSAERDAFSDARASARLAEIRGWELHRTALVYALQPKPERQLIKEDFQPMDFPELPPDKPESKPKKQRK